MFEYERTRKFTLSKETETETPETCVRMKLQRRLRQKENKRRVGATSLPDKRARAKLGFKRKG